MKKFLAGFFLIGWWLNAEAQDSKCEEILNQATEGFAAGHFYEVPTILKPCLDRNDFTNEQKVRAYLLLTQVYLILDDPRDAEDSYLKLLKADPEYVATEEKDPIDVVYLSKKFTSTPIFTPHLRIGLNTSFYRNVQWISTNSEPDDIRHGLRIGFQFGAGIDWNLNNNWSICAEGNFSNKSYKLDVKNIFGNDDLVVIEKHFGLDIPLYLKYAADKGQLRPFGYAGLASNILFSAKSKLVFNNRTSNSGSASSRETNNSTLVASEGPDEDFLYQRKSLSWSLVVGGGVRYKIGKDYVYVDVRYMGGLTNLTQNDNYGPKVSATYAAQPNGVRFNNGTGNALTQYAYVSSYYRLDNLSLSLGYVRPLYDPRKIRKFKIRNIFHLLDKHKNEGKQ